jgi:hypothetical protein
MSPFLKILNFAMKLVLSLLQDLDLACHELVIFEDLDILLFAFGQRQLKFGYLNLKLFVP